MPANKAYCKEIDLKANNGPSIWMEPADHRLTKSWGNSTEASAFRLKQTNLIKQGKYKDAMDLDIQDIEAKFPGKYTTAIAQMTTYYNTISTVKPSPTVPHPQVCDENQDMDANDD